MRRKNLQAIETVLRSLGLLGGSIAMHQLICAIELVHEDMYLVTDMMKGLYPAVAAQFEGASVPTVERNIRSLRDRVWAEGDVNLLRRMAGYNLQVRPTTGEFVDMIRYHMERENLFPDEVTIMK